MVQSNHFDALYVEALGTSLFPPDYVFLNHMVRKRISIFPFIRDIYWKFSGTLHETGFRKIWFRHSERELKWYEQNSKAFFLPSMSMRRHVDFSNCYALPPAGSPENCIKRNLPDNHNIVFMGTISPQSGIDTLLKAFNLVKIKYPDAKLTVVGKGGEKLLKKSEIFDGVHYLGVRDYCEMPRILADSYLTVIPRKKTAYNDFAVPMKLFDYLSCARPVVVTDCSEMASFVRANQVGLVTEDDTAKSISDAIIYLFDNPNTAAEYANNAYNCINVNNSWDCRAKELVERIRENI